MGISRLKNEYHKNVELVVQVLTKLLERHIPWIERKEVAAWTAIAFYVTLISFLFKQLSENIEKLSLIELITIVPISLSFSIIIFSFIQSQFASLYYRITMTNFTQDKIHHLLLTNKLEDNDLDLIKFNFAQILEEEFKKYIEIIQPHIGKKHALKTLFCFWFWVISWFRKKEKYVHIGNRAKQEGAIYSLIIVINLIIIGYIIISIFSRKTGNGFFYLL